MRDRTSISVEGRPSNPSLSAAVHAGDFLFVSGMPPFVPPEWKLVEGGIEEQTRQALRNLEATLTAAGASLTDVVRATVYIADVADFAAVDRVYRQFFASDPPARMTLGAELPGNMLVEVDCIAFHPIPS